MASPRCTKAETRWFATEREARDEAVRAGGTHARERMQGAFYDAPGGVVMRVASRGWASGYELTTYTPCHEQPATFGAVWICLACGAREQVRG
jgi:hypothetical protein